VTAMMRIVAAVAMVLALGALGCHKRAPGACRDDIDCPPGFDCVAGACARRARLTFGGAAGAAGPAHETAPPEAPASSARPGEAPSPVPPAVRPKVAPPAAPPVTPLPPVPEQRLPEWKQRLKNS